MHARDHYDMFMERKKDSTGNHNHRMPSASLVEGANMLTLKRKQRLLALTKIEWIARARILFASSRSSFIFPIEPLPRFHQYINWR